MAAAGLVIVHQPHPHPGDEPGALPPAGGPVGATDYGAYLRAEAQDHDGCEPAPTQPAQTRNQNVSREAAKPSPAPSTERPVVLPSEKDTGLRQRRGRESLRGSPSKKAL